MASETISALNELIETCKDGEKGFARAAQDASDGMLKNLFRDASSRCDISANELQAQVVALGGKPAESGSVLGAAHRGWMDLKTAVSKREDLAILEECERGEDVAKARYTSALRKDLTPAVRAIVEKQFQGVKANHDKIRDLRDQRRAKK